MCADIAESECWEETLWYKKWGGQLYIHPLQPHEWGGPVPLVPPRICALVQWSIRHSALKSSSGGGFEARGNYGVKELIELLVSLQGVSKKTKTIEITHNNVIVRV